MLVDSHCHLDFEAFALDREDVITRAHEAGIGAMLTICTQLNDMPNIAALAETSERIFCSAGVHPHEAEAHDGLTAETLAEQALAAKAVALGETGLDYYYNHSDKEAQKRCLAIHLEVARSLDLPLIIHSRSADDDMAAILRREAGGVKGVMHCFTSGMELAQAALEAGFYISFSGILTFRNASEVRAVAENTPIERLLVETDAPYLAPEPHRGKRNEPAFVVHTAEKLAEVKEVSKEDLIKATGDNFFNLFAKANKPKGQGE